MKIRRVTLDEVLEVLGGGEAEGVRVAYHCEVFGIESDAGEVVSIGAIHWQSSTLVRFKMDYTLPDFRNMGLFGRLLDYRIIDARNRGAKKMRATCLPPSLKGYLKRGAVPVRQYMGGTEVQLNLV